MALQPRRIFVDVQNRTFVSSPNSNLPSADPTWIDEDVESVEIYALKPTGDIAQPYEFLDLSGATVKFAVGTTTPAALQTSFTSIATAVTVTNTQVQEGGTFGGNLDEIQKLTWTGAVPVEGSFSLAFAYRDITYNTSIGSTSYSAAHHGLYNGRTVSIGSQDYTVINTGQSSFSIAAIGSATALAAAATGSATASLPTIVTAPLSYNASLAEIQQAIVEAGFVLNGIPQIIVSGQNGRELTFQFTGRSGRRSYSPILLYANTLKGAPGVQANVSYNTTEIAALVAAGTTAVTMEVEISEGANRQTFRQPATLSPDLITSTSPVPAPGNTSTSFNMQSPDGTVYVVSVTNDGELMIASVP